MSAAQQETLLTRFTIIQSKPIDDDKPPSTGSLLKEAYAKTSFEKPRQLFMKTEKIGGKRVGPRKPQEIVTALNTRITHLKELNENHKNDIDNIDIELEAIKLDLENCKQNAPTAAAKYRFYQELRGYMMDLFDCLNEKVLFTFV